jgi:uncharacterized repeat protein (TIGR01451 family)
MTKKQTRAYLIRWSLLTALLSLSLVVLPGFLPGSSGATAAPDPSSVSTNAEPSSSGLAATPTLFVPNISATKVDSLFTDVNSNTKADPGDTLQYTIAIANSGTDATGVNFTDTIDTNTTLVGGSVNASPLARDDAYTTIGNTRLTVGFTSVGGASVAIPGQNIFDNDSEFFGDTFTVSAFQNPSAQGGNVNINAINGQLDYVPPVGFTGTDTITYTLQDSAGLTGTATITITVNNMVWYVNNASAAGGDGRSTSPFQTLTPVNGAGGAGDVDLTGHFIYVHTGSGNYTTGIELEGTQQLIGEGVALVVSSLTLNPAGTKPTITNTSGNAVTLATGNTVRGLTANGQSGAGIAGSSVGALTIDTVIASATTGAAIDLQTTGALAVTLESATSTTGTNGLRVTNAASGSFTVSGATTVTNAVTTGINLSTNATATFTFTGGVTVSTTAGTGILANNTGTVNIGGVANTVTSTGGPALDITNTSLGSGATFATASSTNSAGRGLNLDTVSGTLTIGGGSITGPTGEGARVNAGGSNITYSGTITKTASGNLILVQSRTGGTVAFGGNLSATTPSGGILVQSNTTGTPTVTFSGATKTLNTGANAGVNLNNNGSTVINFTGGGLDIDTTSATGFAATTGGTVIVTGSGNSITTTTGTALNVSSSTIGGSGLNFQSITTTSASGNTGINLNATGSAGGLTVSGTGSAGSGGTISNKTTNAIALNSTSNFSLSFMNIQNNSGSGVLGTTVTAFSLTSCLVDNNSDALDGSEANLRFTSLLGTCSITNTTIQHSDADNVRIFNYNQSTALSLTITNGSIGLIDGIAGNGVTLEAGDDTGSSGVITTVSLVATGVTFSGNDGAPMVLNALRNCVASNYTFNNCIITNNGTGPDVGWNSNADVNFSFTNNTITGSIGNGVDVVEASNVVVGSLVNGTITGNNIGNGTADSGSRDARGIAIDLRGDGNTNLTISNNNVRNADFENVYIDTGSVAGADGDASVTLTNNTIGTPDDNSAFPLLFIEAVRITSRQNRFMCLDIDDNSISPGVGGATSVIVRQANTAVFQLEGFVGDGTNATTVANFITGRNTTGNTAVQTTGTGTIVNYTGIVSCAVLSTAQLEAMQVQGEETAAFAGNRLYAGIGTPREDLSAPLSQQELDRIVDAAILRLINYGISIEELDRIQRLRFEVGDIEEEGRLVAGDLNRLVLDSKAAGYGWFVDPTPATDEEFTETFGSGRRVADPGSDAVRRLDLLTAVIREMLFTVSHEKKRTMTVTRGLFNEQLTAGVRALPVSDNWVSEPTAPSDSEKGDGTVGVGSTPVDGVRVDRSLRATIGRTLKSVFSSLLRPVTLAFSRESKPTPPAAVTAGVDSNSPATGTLSEPAAVRSESEPAASAPIVVQGESGGSAPAGQSVDQAAPMPAMFNPAAGRPLARQVRYASMRNARSATLTPFAGETVSLAIGSLPAGKSVTIVFRATINTPVTPAGTTQVCNQGTVTADGPISVQTDDPDVVGAANPTCTQLAVADLSITKTGSPDPDVAAGSNITYTINFTNNGPDGASNVTVSDPTPANTTLVSVVTPAGWTRTDLVPAGGTGTITFTKASAANAETAQFTIVVNVNPATPGSTTITNTVTTSSNTPDGTQGNNSATDTTNVVAQADLSVTKTNGTTTEIPGTPTTYTIVVTNNGPNQVTGATVADTFPAALTGVTFTSVTTGTVSGNTASGSGNINDTVNMSNGATITYTVTGTINPAATGSLSNTVTVTVPAGVTDPVPANNSATDTDTLDPQGDLSITKTDGAATEIPGSTVTYTIVVSNAGPSTATGATAADTFPGILSGVTFTSVAAGGATGNTASGSGNINDTLTLPPGASVTYTATGTIDSAATGSLSNTATVTAPAGFTDTNGANNSATDTDTLTPQADLSVTKSDAPDPVVAGSNITYTINFANNGPSDAQTVTVTDAVPAGTTFVSASVTTGTGWGTSAPAVGGTGNVVFSKATVVAAETAVFSIVVNVTPSTTGIVTNSATAATATTDPNAANNTGTATTTVNAEADLAVTKSDSPDPVFAGNNITYTINFTNNGPSFASSVTVTDAVPANTTFVSASVTTGTGWSISAPAVGGTGNVVFSKASVANGETAVFQVVVNVNATTADATIITNNAVGATTATDPTPGNNTGTATTTVQASADLAVTKSDAPDPVTAGNNITYTINFSNSGPSAAGTVTVTDATPTNTTFVSAAVTTGTGWSISAPAVGGTGNVVFSKGAVANGETAVFSMVVKVNSNTASGSTISNSAVAASVTPDPTPANNTGNASTTVQTSADLAVTKSDSPDPVSAGGNITYTVNFVNNGPSDAANVTVTDAVPTNTTFVSAVVTTGTGWGTSAPAVGGTGNVVFSKAAVAAGETAVFTIVVNVNASTADGATITNTATAATDTTDPTPANNSATATTTVDRVADLAVTKGDAPDPVIAGNNITYTINFVNNGPSDTTTVTVTDAVPANTTFVSASVTTGTGWSTSAPAVGGTGNVVFSKAAVANGETAVFSIVVKVSAATAGGSTITNNAVAAGADTDNVPANNTGTATTTVNADADLAVTKGDSPDPVVAGTNLTYTINFMNNGPSNAATVAVSDPLPAGTTFVSAAVTTGTGWGITSPAVGANGTVTFSKASVPPAQTATFSIVVNVSSSMAAGATLSNTATAASATTDSTPGNNSATATTTVQRQSDMMVTKVASGATATPGGNLTYTITVKNNGPSEAANVVVTDPTPANTTFVSAAVTTGTGWSIMSPPVGGTGNVVFTKPAMVLNETAVFTLVVNVDMMLGSSTAVTNVVTVASDSTDPVPGNSTATAAVSLFDVCIYDPIKKTLLRFSRTSGAWQFFECAKGTPPVSGMGLAEILPGGCKIKLTHPAPGGPKTGGVTITATGNICTGVGTATVVVSGVTHTLTDPNINDGTCSCPVP